MKINTKVENCAFSKWDPVPGEGFQMQPGLWISVLRFFDAPASLKLYKLLTCFTLNVSKWHRLNLVGYSFELTSLQGLLVCFDIFSGWINSDRFHFAGSKVWWVRLLGFLQWRNLLMLYFSFWYKYVVQETRSMMCHSSFSCAYASYLIFVAYFTY